MRQEKLRAALFAPGEKAGDRAFRWFPWIWLAVAYVATLLLLCLCGRSYIDSDMASDLILAELLNQEGGILSTQWWYSTELNVFCEQIVYRLGLAIFPGSWYAARMLGQAILILALLGAYLYVGHGLRLKQCGAWGAAALACPLGVCYLWYALLGGFYLPYMTLLLLGFGALLHLLRPAGGRARMFHGAVLLVSSLMFGMNGLKGMMGFYIPMVLTALAALGLQWHLQPQKRPRRESRLLGLALAAFLAAGAGYAVYSAVLLPGHYTMSYSSRLWNKMSAEALLGKMTDFLTLFGYPIDSSVGGEVSLFSAEGLLCAFGILTAGAIVASLARLLWRWKELDPVQRVAPLLFGSAWLVQSMIFAWTGELTDTSPYTGLTILPLAFPVLQLEGETEHFRIPHARRAAAVAFSVCILATSVGSSLRYFTSGYRTNPHLAEVCTWLQDQGYTQGYATFWNGNVLTEWSDGEIEMWVTQDFATLQPHQWLQKTSHAQPPEGPVFLLTTMDELGGMGLSELYWWSDVVYEDSDQAVPDRTKRYVVMAYENAADLQAAVQGALSQGEAGA